MILCIVYILYYGLSSLWHNFNPIKHLTTVLLRPIECRLLHVLYKHLVFCTYFHCDGRGRHCSVLGNVGSLHRSSRCSRHVLRREGGVKYNIGTNNTSPRAEKLFFFFPKTKGSPITVRRARWFRRRTKPRLTVPVVPRDRWFICWARGAMTLEGWRDKLGSMAAAGAMTAPWGLGKEGHTTNWVTDNWGQSTIRWPECQRQGHKWDMGRQLKTNGFFFIFSGNPDGVRGWFSWYTAQ